MVPDPISVVCEQPVHVVTRHREGATVIALGTRVRYASGVRRVEEVRVQLHLPFGVAGKLLLDLQAWQAACEAVGARAAHRVPLPGIGPA